MVNLVGVDPGIWLEIKESIIVSLPDVPQELKAIFQEHLIPPLVKIFGLAFQLERTVQTFIKDESFLAQILVEISRQFLNVHLKSKPTRFGPEVELEVCLTI